MTRQSAYHVGLMLSILLIALVITTPVNAKSDRLLKSPTKTISSTQSLPQWQKVLSKHQVDKTSKQSVQYKEWQDFISSIRHEPKIRQLMQVNLWFKKVAHKQDNWIYRTDDYWATPAEFLKNGGDCEDYAIAKYMTLKQLGFKAKDLKITMVYDVYSGTDHAFLVAYHDGAEFVLDNREKLVVSRYMKKRYKPYYAFNERKIWIFDKPLIALRARANDETILPGNR